jgi:hypothetical protein
MPNKEIIEKLSEIQKRLNEHGEIINSIQSDSNELFREYLDSIRKNNFENIDLSHFNESESVHSVLVNPKIKSNSFKDNISAHIDQENKESVHSFTDEPKNCTCINCKCLDCPNKIKTKQYQSESSFCQGFDIFLSIFIFFIVICIIMSVIRLVTKLSSFNKCSLCTFNFEDIKGLDA